MNDLILRYDVELTTKEKFNSSAIYDEDEMDLVLLKVNSFKRINERLRMKRFSNPILYDKKGKEIKRFQI